jgi:glycosyltransferase involved in cell wall biosynthesis
VKKILILNNNYFGDRLAGISIRFYEIARALSGDFQVTLALSNIDEYKAQRSAGFSIESFKTESDIVNLMKRHDAVFTRGLNIINSKKLSRYDIPMIFDLLCPFFFENLEADKDSPGNFNSSLKENIDLINRLASRGDFFVCANENQRSFWLSALYKQKRITVDIYRQDPSLNDLIDIVPFGLPTEKPFHSKNALKGAVKGIGANDKVVTWFGGLWDWLDPISPISAMESLCKKRNDIKLVFIGIKHPDPRSKPHDIYAKVMEKAGSSGLLNKNIFFIDWVPYETRANYLLESDIGIITHRETLETKFSWRTRVLDYIWAGLPIVMTKGDPMSAIVENKSLGMTVDYNDPSSIEKAILKIIDDEGFRQKTKDNLARMSKEYEWKNVVKPIANFCKDPVRTSGTRSFLRFF